MTEEETTLSEQWGTVELMGHGQTAGRISRPTEWGGLLRVDVPTGDGGYKTEFYSMNAIYAVKFTSEEIARAFVVPDERIYSFDTPIVTRAEHNAAVSRVERENNQLRFEMGVLERRLTAVHGLPAGEPDVEDVAEDGAPF